MKMIHIKDGPPLHTNCFLMIGDAGHAAVIDPAAPAAAFEKALEENGATLTHILLTHGHHDHVASVEPLRKKYGAKLYMNQADADQFDMQPEVAYTDFGTITVDEMTFTTIFTPGHTPGSTIIQCGDKLFSGDTLFKGTIGRTDLPGSNDDHMKASLKKIVENVTENLQVLPGHEGFSTMEQERAHNRYLKF